MKHIGIVAASVEGAALAYRSVVQIGAERLGPDRHPEVSLHHLDLHGYRVAVEADDWTAVGERMLRSGEALARAGADFLICAANTPHQGLDRVRDRSPLPWLHIAEVVLDEALRRGLKRLLLLGTRPLMLGPVYPPHARARGIELVLPEEAERDEIQRNIFEELVHGRLEPSTRRSYIELVERSAGSGCDGVILGCTEIPLIVTEDDLCLPALDSTRLLAAAAVDEAIA